MSSHSALWSQCCSPIPRTGDLENSRHLFSQRNWIFFPGCLKMKDLETLWNYWELPSGGRRWNFSSLPFAGAAGPQDHQRPGSQAGVGVWALSSAGEGCLTVRHWRIVSRLKNGLNWPAMEKSTAGSFGAACSDLGEVSQEISNSAGFLS